jgi:hypothetical protein
MRKDINNSLETQKSSAMFFSVPLNAIVESEDGKWNRKREKMKK